MLYSNWRKKELKMVKTEMKEKDKNVEPLCDVCGQVYERTGTYNDSCRVCWDRQENRTLFVGFLGAVIALVSFFILPAVIFGKISPWWTILLLGAYAFGHILMGGGSSE
jgi:hypothetical protein